MAWGLEARVPFLDKAFLEVAMNINPEEKMFNKGGSQEVDEDGCPKMEKVRRHFRALTWRVDLPSPPPSTSSAKLSILHQTARCVAFLRLLP